MKTTWVRPLALTEADAVRLLGAPLDHEHTLADLLKRPDVDFDAATEIAAIARPDHTTTREALRSELGQPLADAVIEQVQVSIKYAGYIDKQNRDVGRAVHYEGLKLPDDLDYAQVQALSFEARQKLGKHRPETLGQAARISGITPASVSLLLVHLKKSRFQGFARLDDRPADVAV